MKSVMHDFGIMGWHETDLNLQLLCCPKLECECDCWLPFVPQLGVVCLYAIKGGLTMCSSTAYAGKH